MTITTTRLRLTPLRDEHAQAMQAAASDRDIADTMISIPHPYPAGEAARWIARQRAAQTDGRATAFAIEAIANDKFCGVVALRDIDREHEQAELSFWLARSAWNQGYMSEVVTATLRYGFETLGLNRLYAHHMVRNPASGRVLEKNGFTQEAVLRDRVKKWDVFEDVCLWAILKREWAERNEELSRETVTQTSR